MTYWLLTLLLVGFGVVAGFSIGLPFLLVGLAMLGLGPFRHRTRLFWPALLGSVAFVVVAFSVAPFWCEASSTLSDGSSTVCRSLIGLTWSSPGISNPPPEASWLAIVSGLAAAVLVATLTFVSVRRTPDSSRRPPADGPRPTSGP